MPKYTAGLSNGKQIGPLPEGDYPFAVIDAQLKQSKKGSEMIQLILEAGGNGSTVRIFDYLVFDGGLFTSARIDQFRIAIGETILPGEEVNFEATDALDKTGQAHVVIEEYLGKKVNRIGSYLEPADEIPGLEKPKAKPAKAKVDIPY